MYHVLRRHETKDGTQGHGLLTTARTSQFLAATYRGQLTLFSC